MDKNTLDSSSEPNFRREITSSLPKIFCASLLLRTGKSHQQAVRLRF